MRGKIPRPALCGINDKRKGQMKTHPFRGAQAGKGILRDRILANTEKSLKGKRVVCECQEALAKPVNSDLESRKIVLNRFATELEIFPEEMEELLRRADPQNSPNVYLSPTKKKDKR
jgi:hypothetical protein